MNKATEQDVKTSGKRRLADFVYGGTDGRPFDIHVAVKEDGRCAVFHNKPFKNELAWLEFDLDTNRLDFVMDDGDIRDVGLPLSENVSKNMQNSHQVLVVLMDEEGKAKEGKYIPLILHGK